MIKIEKANNGYIVRTDRIDEPDDVTVIEGEDGEQAFMKLCNYLAEENGFTQNRFGSFNFRCSFDGKGSKVEPEDPPVSV